MLLDLDQGSMTVWKNNEKVGVMGLRGPLCWVVSMHYWESSSVRIASAPIPALPTGEGSGEQGVQ